MSCIQRMEKPLSLQWTDSCPVLSCIVSCILQAGRQWLSTGLFNAFFSPPAGWRVLLVQSGRPASRPAQVPWQLVTVNQASTPQVPTLRRPLVLAPVRGAMILTRVLALLLATLRLMHAHRGAFPLPYALTSGHPAWPSGLAASGPATCATMLQ